MDRISNLPDPIAHHIMSFLSTTDVTKISVLSKRFLFLWSSFPVIEFDDEIFARSLQGRPLDLIINRFLDYIHSSILLRRFDTAMISEFRVKANLERISSDSRFDLAISIALQNGVRCMDLNLGLSSYQLPANFASTSIYALRLQGLKLDLCKLIQNCPSLRTVSLTSCEILQDIKFSSQTLTEMELQLCAVRVIKINAPNLHSFSYSFHSSGAIEPEPCLIDVSQCEDITYLSMNNVLNGQHLMEDHVHALCKLKTFILSCCQDIQDIKVKNDTLERLEIRSCPALASIKLRAKSLKSFVYKGIQDRDCNISFIASECMKDLWIEGATITAEGLETLLDTLCYLESLKIQSCNFLEKIRVFHEKLQILELSDCKQLAEADINTPELVSFVYHGEIFEFKKMVTRNNCVATLSMEPWITYNNASFFRWLNLLSYFSHCKTLKLVCTSKEVLIPDILRERQVSPLYDLQNMEIEIESLEKIGIDLVDSLLWLAPLPKAVRISSRPQSHLQMIIKFTYNDMTEDEEDEEPFCCVSKPIKCWKHYLKSVEIHCSDVLLNNRSAELQKYFPTKAIILDSL